MSEAAEKLHRDDLILEYQEYVHFIAGKLINSMRLPNTFFDEYVSAGYLGLVEAAERFDPTLGTSFKNYAFLRIRGAIIDSIRKTSDLSAQAYKQARAFEAAQELREEEFYLGSSSAKDSNSKQTLARALNFAAKGALAFRISMSQQELEDLPEEEDSENPEKALALKQSLEKIKELLATLPAKERLVIEEYYFKDTSFSEIARKYEGMSKSWISRLHSKALSKLQESLQESLGELQ